MIVFCAGIRGSAGHSASSIAVAHTPFGEVTLPDASSSGSKPEAEAAVRLRERCKAMLEIHMRHSFPREAATGSAAADTLQRAMQCSRNGELHGVVQELLKALSEHAAKVMFSGGITDHEKDKRNACCFAILAYGYFGLSMADAAGQ